MKINGIEKLNSTMPFLILVDYGKEGISCPCAASTFEEAANIIASGHYSAPAAVIQIAESNPPTPLEYPSPDHLEIKDAEEKIQNLRAFIQSIGSKIHETAENTNPGTQPRSELFILKEHIEAKLKLTLDW